MKKSFGIWAAALIFLSMLFANNPRAIPLMMTSGDKGWRNRPTGVFGIHRPFWTPNRIGDYITNDGQLVSHIPTGSSGMEWPLGSHNTLNFASGLWLAGQKDGEIVTAAAWYSSEFQPGTVIRSGGGGIPADPNDPRFRVYIINQGSTTDLDYIQWPVADGAPVDRNGKPLLLGTSTAWAVFNDFNPNLHLQNELFKTKPIGVEVQMTAWAYNHANALGDMMFFKFKCINKSGKDIAETYVAFWADIDIGDANDLVGCDTTLALGYVYKYQKDGLYGSTPPALGYDFLQGPIIPAPGEVAMISGKKKPGFKNLSMTFPRIEKHVQQFHEPETAQEVYHLMRSLDLSGQALTNPLTGKPTKFVYPGDPLTKTGWVDTVAYDKRILLSSGPFSFADGDTQEVVCVIVIAQGQNLAQTIQRLKQNDALAQQLYDNNFITTVNEKTTNMPVNYALQQNFPNPFNRSTEGSRRSPATTFAFSIPRDEFVRLKIYNTLGKEVATVVEKKFSAGHYQVKWESLGLTTGLYFYRLQAGDFVQTKKFTLLR